MAEEVDKRILQEQARTSKADVDLVNIDEQDLRTFIGKNAEYFISARRLIIAGQRTQWNWAACAWAPFWFGYRKCWMFVGLAFVVELVPYAIFIAPFVFGAYGTRWYLEHCAKKISQIRHLQKNPNLYDIELREQGGTSAIAVLMLLVASILLSGWAVLSIMPSLM